MTARTASGIPLHVFATAEAAGEYAAREVAARLAVARSRGAMTLGCPGGRSLRTTYAALARRFAEQHTDLRTLHLLMMDEYVLQRGAHWVSCASDAHYSCRRFGEVEIRAQLNAGVAPGARIPAANLHVPDPNAPDDYEALIERLGGIDVFLLASGQSDGHVAFNPRGTPREARTRVVELSHATRRDNLSTFPQFRTLARVPRFGVGVGPDTIARHSRATVMLLLGAGKAEALRRLASARGYDAEWPATILVECDDAQIVADAAAAVAAEP